MRQAWAERVEGGKVPWGAYVSQLVPFVPIRKRDASGIVKKRGGLFPTHRNASRAIARGGRTSLGLLSRLARRAVEAGRQATARALPSTASAGAAGDRPGRARRPASSPGGHGHGLRRGRRAASGHANASRPRVRGRRAVAGGDELPARPAAGTGDEKEMSQAALRSLYFPSPITFGGAGYNAHGIQR
jgi:hypothetical protein